MLALYLFYGWLLGLFTMVLAGRLNDWLRLRHKSTPYIAEGDTEEYEVPVIRKGDLIVIGEDGMYRKMRPEDVQSETVTIGVAAENVSRTEFLEVKAPRG